MSAVHQAEAVPLRCAVRQMATHPLVLLREWNWKAAAVSAAIRASIFLVGNLRAGHGSAAKAMLTEAVYATIAAGLVGSVTQRLRHAEPRWKTGLVVWIAMPLAMLAGQVIVHTVVGTPHLRGSLIASFVFAALATGFNWFAMARGAFVTGEGRSFTRDLLLLPRLLAQFVTALPRIALYRGRGAK